VSRKFVVIFGRTEGAEVIIGAGRYTAIEVALPAVG
jgi:hypothetical protein